MQQHQSGLVDQQRVQILRHLGAGLIVSVDRSGRIFIFSGS